MWMNRLHRSFLVVAVVAASSSWGNQSAVEEGTKSEAASDTVGIVSGSFRFDQEDLLYLERTLPAIHQLLINDEWQYIDGFAKYRLVSARLLKQWGAEDPYQSIRRINELENLPLKQYNTQLAMALDSGSSSLLRRFVRTERTHERYKKLVEDLADTIQIPPQHKELIDFDGSSACLTKLLNSDRQSLLVAERRFIRILSECTETSPTFSRNNFSALLCPSRTASSLQRELSDLMIQSARGSTQCMRAMVADSRISKKSTSELQMHEKDSE